MYIAGRWSDRQLTRMELAAAVIIIGVLMAGLMRHTLRLFATAERSLLTVSVVNVNTALQYRAAWYLLNNDYAALEQMQDMNPFALRPVETGVRGEGLPAGVSPRLLAGLVELSPPPGYLGEVEIPEPESIAGGQWYFDRGMRTLVYRVDNPEYFETSLVGPARVEFYVHIDYEDTNNNNRFEAGAGEYRTIQLRATHDYAWRL